MHRRLIIAAGLFLGFSARAQTLGGSSVFQFVNLPNTPRLTALGGVNVSHPANDIGLAFHNPALLTHQMHGQVNLVFNDFIAGIQVFHLSGGYSSDRLKTNFLAGITYFNYGTVSSTDASGNVLGSFRPRDWVVQLGASRQYLEKWRYGASLKFLSSGYGQYRSNGIAVDVGVLYSDTTRLFTASVLVRNMGFQIRKYPGAGVEDMPFDLQAGITKRLASAPVSFSLSAGRLHRFDLTYNDTAFNNENGYPNGSEKRFSWSKLISHFVVGATIYMGDRVEVHTGYNFLRRKDLAVPGGSNGLSGFSMGATVLLNGLQVSYARAYYQGGSAYNQFGLHLPLANYFDRRPGVRSGGQD